MNSTPQTFSRRAVLGAIGGLAVAGAGIGAFASRASGARIDALTVSDTAITTDDGTITDVTVSVDGDWLFDGLDVPMGHSVDGVQIYLKAGRPGNEYRIASDYQETGNVRAASGEFSFSDESLIVSNNVNSLALTDFTDGEEDESPEVTTVGVVVEMVITLNGPANPQWGRTGWTASNETTFDVSVTNQPAESQVGGNGSSSVTGENQFPGGPGDVQQLRLVWSAGEEAFRVDNLNPDGTAPVAYQLRLYGSSEIVAADVIDGGHSGYEVPTGNYHAIDVDSTTTVELWANGQKIDQTNRS